MNIENLASLPSDPDITVLLVKKKLEQLQNSRGDDRGYVTASSLVNVVTSNDNLSGHFFIATSNITDGKHVSNKTASMKSSPRKTKNVNNPQTSEESMISIRTIQNIYSASELSDTSECNNGIFVDVDLHGTSNVNLGNPILDPSKKKNKSVFKCLLPCVFGRKSKEDEQR